MDEWMDGWVCWGHHSSVDGPACQLVFLIGVWCGVRDICCNQSIN